MAFREASSAVRQAETAVRDATRIDFERRGWTPGGGFAIVPATQDLRDAAWFAGSVWLAGSGGLARYSPDGRLERQWTAGADLPGAPLTALAVGLDPRGGGPALFAATAGEGLLIVDGGGRLEHVRSAQQSAQDILALLPLPDGRLLLGTQQAGVLVYDSAGLGYLHRDLSSGHAVALAGTPEQIWIATLNDGLIRFQAGAIERFDERSGMPDRRLLSLAFSRDRVFAGAAVGVAELVDGIPRRTLADGFFASALWTDGASLHAGTLQEGIVEIPLDRSRNASVQRPRSTAPQDVRKILELDGELYAVTPEALWQRSADGSWQVAIEPPALLRDRNISALHVDRSGQVWVGYFDQGLDLVSGDSVTARVDDDVVFCVNRIVQDEKRDLIAVATANGLAFLDAAGTVRQTLRRADGLMADHVTDIVFRADGWVASSPAGLTFFDAAGLRGLYALHGLVNNHVYTLAARGETLVAGTLGGLSILEAGVVRKSFTTANSPLGHNWISALVGFRNDWFVGTYGAGVARLTADGDWRSFDAMQGVEINPNAIAVSAGRLYAGTLDRGLLVYSPESEQWNTVVQGLPSANVTALAYVNGTLYVGTDNGLARIAEEGLSLQ